MIPIKFELDKEQLRHKASREARVFVKRCTETALVDRIAQSSSEIELENIAIEHDLCDYCSFSRLSLEMARLFLSAVVKILYKFPRVRSKLCYIGSKSGFVDALRELCKLNRKTIERFRIQQICSDETIINLASHALIAVDNTVYNEKSANVLAQAFSLCGILDAVVLDESDFSGLGYKRLCKQLAKGERDGTNLKGCEKPDSVVYHEFGHLLDFLCNLNEDSEFQKYYQSFTKEQIARKVSPYAATDASEFFAEAFAEYVSSSTPREVALYLGQLIERKYTNKFINKEKNKMSGINNESKTERKVDIIFCIDGTGSMAPCIDSVKANAKRFYADFAEKMTNEFSSSVDEVNIKVITFRDYEADGSQAMTISEWFELTAGDDEKYANHLKGIIADGGGDEPENGLEALFYAMTSDWRSRGDKDRQIIVLFTDADAKSLGGNGVAGYPTDMVDEAGLLNTWMCIRPGFLSQGDFKLRERCKRLLMFAPHGTVYEKMQSQFNRSQFIPTAMDQGLGEIDFDDIIKVIAASASAVSEH